MSAEIRRNLSIRPNHLADTLLSTCDSLLVQGFSRQMEHRWDGTQSVVFFILFFSQKKTFCVKQSSWHAVSCQIFLLHYIIVPFMYYLKFLSISIVVTYTRNLKHKTDDFQKHYQCGKGWFDNLPSHPITLVVSLDVTVVHNYYHKPCKKEKLLLLYYY